MNSLLNFKSFFKFLSKNKSYTFIDVFGLSVSLMFVIIIAVYTKQELSTDTFHEKGERLYALCNGESFGSAFRLAYRIQDRYPEVEKVCPMTFEESMPVTITGNKYNADLLFADSTFFDMFSFELLYGDKYKVMETRNYAVVSQSFANRTFPGMDPIGQSIIVNDSVTVIVNGVMKDIKNSTIKYADILLRIDNIKYFNSSMDSESFGNAGSTVIFILTHPNSDIQTKEEDLAEHFKEIFWMYQMGLRDKVLFVPVREIYFSDYKTWGYILNQGEWRFVMILMSVGVLILIFAIINYINLTVAQTGFRAKEMATRRLLGSSRSELFMRLMMESTLLTFFSFLIGLLLAFAFVPFANNLLETKIHLDEMFTWENILLSLVVIFTIGCIAGLLPALIISNAKPIDVVRGGFRKKTKMVFSKFFITFQNIITITMIAASVTMVLQINHLINAPLGYNNTGIIDINCYSLANKEQSFTLRNELSRLPVVKRIGMSQGTPFTRGNNSTTEYEDKNVSFQIVNVDQTAYDMLGFQILQDNQLGNNDGFYMTEYTFKYLEIPHDIPALKMKGGWEFPVSGVLKDFQLRNITHGESCILMKILQGDDFYPWNILVEVSGDQKEAYEQVRKVYEDITQLEFTGEYMDMQIMHSFDSQRRTSKIVMVFSFIAVLISLLGLLAMSTYFIQQRSREVAVRKVFGSSNREILMKLILTFLNYVLVAFVISIPLIWHFMRKWLSDYTYRISLSPWIFIIAGLFCLVISFLTVFWQSRKAANANPVDSIKAE